MPQYGSVPHQEQPAGIPFYALRSGRSYKKYCNNKFKNIYKFIYDRLGPVIICTLNNYGNRLSLLKREYNNIIKHATYIGSFMCYEKYRFSKSDIINLYLLNNNGDDESLKRSTQYNSNNIYLLDKKHLISFGLPVRSKV